jgi:hypothetical protein
METAQLNVTVQDKLVEIDNLINALNYLKERLETEVPTVDSVAHRIAGQIDSGLISNSIRHITISYLNAGNFTHSVLEPLVRERISPQLDGDMVKETIRGAASSYIESEAFRERTMNYLKRYQIPGLIDGIKNEVEDSVEKHLESYLLAKVDERVSLALSRGVS